MHVKLTILAVVVFSAFYSSRQLFVVSQQDNVQPYFTEWNGSYYLFMYQPVGSVTWGLAFDTCQGDGGLLPVITVAERDALIEDFYKESSQTDDDGFVWLGANCSGITCTGAGTVLEDRLWDQDFTSGYIYYPTANAGNNPNRALAWFKVRGKVQDTLRNNTNAVEYFCKYDNLCDSASVNCQAGGACVKVSSFTRPQCICNDGYQPMNNNSDCADINECLSDPCPSPLDTSLCVDEVNSYRCDCIDGFTGDMCEINIDECVGETCSGAGDCVDETGFFSCDCHPGYTGELCEVDIDECELMDEPCHSNGDCVDGINTFNCTCFAGYTGELCDVNIDECELADEPCSANGNCTDGIDMFSCTCLPGYTGQRCEFAVHTTVTVDDHCALVDEPCNANGMCEDGADSFICVCFDGYTGERCDIDINECELVEEPCHSNGNCVDDTNTFSCACLAGYTGERCEYGIGDCALVDEPCNTNGNCTDGIDTLICTCFPSYTGQHCEFVVNTTTAEAQVSSSDNTLLIGVVVGLVVLTLVASVVVYRILRRQGETVLDSETAVRNTEEANNTYEPPPPVANKVYSSSDSSDNDDNN